MNKLCRETESKIVVSSTWRFYENYKECLYKGGLNKDIEILGKTPNLGTKRGIEIQHWLDENEDLNIEKFVIIDDDMDMEHLMDYLVVTDTHIGMTYYTYEQAKKMLESEE